VNWYALLGIVFVAGILLGFVIGQETYRRLAEPRHVRELERLANLLRYGQAELPQAVKMPGPPDAVRVLHKKIHDDRVNNAAAVIMDAYKEKGLTISEEEARLQVESMIAGRAPVEVPV
jgi:hypothetical protein